jgi:outer membrane protein TolC
MSTGQSNGKAEEQRLVKLYMDLTGTSESAARNVYMFVGPQEENSTKGSSTTTLPLESKRSQPKSPAATVIIFASLLISASVVGGAPVQEPPKNSTYSQTASNNFLSAPLTLADAINLALQGNANVLRAQKDLEASQGVAVQTRALALPAVGVAGSYQAVQQTDIDIFRLPTLTFGTPQNWSSQVKLVQSFYEGGRLLSSFRIARLTKERSALDYQTVVADTVLGVQLGYYDVLLGAQQITVQEASVELLTRELSDTTRRFEAGTVPRFNVLRAEVELANARPKLINARNNFRVSKTALANLLGFNVPHETVEDIPLNLAGKLEDEPYDINLAHALALALERRTELASLRKTEALRKEDIVTAKAGYKPLLQGFVGYDVHNSMLSSDLWVKDHGWIAGGQLTWNLFDGWRTQGRIKEANANHERAEVDVDDGGRRIALEVRTSYSNFIEAREVLDSQKKVVEVAEEALRLARARSEAGTGTQLDVLSAQTALTDARTTQVQALHDYDAARARLQRAVGENMPEKP